MATNVFSLLPHDIKMYEITRFLTHADTLSFNSVLRRDERVWKKLPRDYAIKHHILTVKTKFDVIAAAAQKAIEDADEKASVINMEPIPRFVVTLTKLFKFLADPFNKPIFMYQQGLKESQLKTIDYWILDVQNDAENDFWRLLSSEQRREIKRAAKAAGRAVSETPFVRQISLSAAARAAQSIF